MPAVAQSAILSVRSRRFAPVDSALVGFFGVIAGALTTGVVQIGVESRRRRSEALSAARLVLVHLVSSHQVLETRRVKGFWIRGVGQGQRRFDADLQVWAEQRERVATVVGTAAYTTLDSAFSNLGGLDDRMQRAGRRGRIEGEVLETWRSNLSHHEVAMDVAFEAGRSTSERLRRRTLEQSQDEILYVTDPEREPRYGLPTGQVEPPPCAGSAP